MFYKTNLFDLKKIVCIEKIYNPQIYKRVEVEFRRMIFTYQEETADHIAKHLFTGFNVNSEQLYNSYNGFSEKFFKNERYGKGLYFTENSGQSIDAAYVISD